MKTKLKLLTILAITFTLALAGCESKPEHNPRAGKVPDGGPGGQFAGGNN